MANLIDISFFKDDTHVASISVPAVREKLERFISRYEPELMDKLLGVELYEEFKEGLSVEPVLPKWQLLKNGGIITVDGKKRRWAGLANSVTGESLIAKYVFYHYTVDLVNPIVGIGTIQPKAENGEYLVPTARLVRVWNEFSKEVENLLFFLKDNPSDYSPINDYRYYRGRWGCGFREWEFGRINEFGI